MAELLIGGILAGVRESDWVTVEAIADAKKLSLSVDIQNEKSHHRPELEYFFGANARGQAPALAMPASAIASFSVHRDIALLWRNAGDLFGQRVNDQLAQADATLTTLFSGRDFGEEILGAIEPGVQLIVAPSDLDEKAMSVPQIKVPAFALVGHLRDPQTMQPQLKRIFMSLVGFINVTGAMNRQPQLDLETQTSQNITKVFAAYVAEADRVPGRPVPIQLNFSPTLIIADKTLIISSTRPLAERLLDERDQSKGSNSIDKADIATNSRVRLNGEQISQALLLNRSQLVSQNVIEKGHTQTEAEREVDTLIRIVDLVRSLEIEFDVASTVSLRGSIELNENAQ